MRILILGPSITRSKGGTATVIDEHLANPIINKQNKLKYLNSHVDGNIIQKAFHLVKCILHIVFFHSRYDIIHIHSNSGISFYRKSVLVRVSKLFLKKTIIHMHGHDFDKFYSNNSPVLKRYIRSSLKKCDKIIVLSNYWKNFFDREFASLNVEILHNGVDISSYEKCITDPASYNKFLFLGKLEERKGVFDLVDAIDSIVNSHGRKELQFYFAGDGEVDKVRKIASERGLAGNIKVLGWLNKDEKRKILHDVETVILPSYEENLPMSLIEAMACGKVLISSYAGGIPDLITPDFNGYLVNAGDVGTLADSILLVNENPKKMKEISKNNIYTVNKDFNIDSLAIDLNSIYKVI